MGVDPEGCEMGPAAADDAAAGEDQALSGEPPAAGLSWLFFFGLSEIFVFEAT